MRESRTYGSVRGALSNGRPYRVTGAVSRVLSLPPTSESSTATVRGVTRDCTIDATWCALICRRCYNPLDSLRGPTVRNNSAPPKWSKLWTDMPRPSDQNGAYTIEQLERMNQEFTAAVERAFRVGGESRR